MKAAGLMPNIIPSGHGGAEAQYQSIKGCGIFYVPVSISEESLKADEFTPSQSYHETFRY